MKFKASWIGAEISNHCVRPESRAHSPLYSTHFNPFAASVSRKP